MQQLVLLLESVLLRPEALGRLLIQIDRLVGTWVLEVVRWRFRPELLHFEA